MNYELRITNSLVSIIIASMKEEHTIGRALETFLNGYQGDFEVLVSIPDEPTWQALLAKATQLGIADKIKRSEISKLGKAVGKPRELNELMDMARGEIWLFGDGDTFFGENVINKLLTHFDNPEVMAVTGRPRSSDPKNSMMGYFGNLLADAAHHKRKVDLLGDSSRALSWSAPWRARTKRDFFPVSGYLFAMRATDIRAPQDTLVEDAYFSYEIYNRGGRIEYEPTAEVFVKYPKSLADYFKQKKRSTGGYVQLWKYGVVKPETKTRSFWRELEYFWFPLTYAGNLREFFWSLMLYPIRLWMWMMIYWEQKVLKKDFARTWVRIESTK